MKILKNKLTFINNYNHKSQKSQKNGDFFIYIHRVGELSQKLIGSYP